MTFHSIQCRNCRKPYTGDRNTFYGSHSQFLCDLCRTVPCNCHSCTLYRQPSPELKEVPKVATVNFCEREKCQTMGKSSAMGSLLYSISEGAQSNRIEICPGCVAEFVEWLNAAPTDERPRAYQDPYDPKKKSTLDGMSGDELMKMGLEKMRKELEA